MAMLKSEMGQEESRDIYLDREKIGLTGFEQAGGHTRAGKVAG